MWTIPAGSHGLVRKRSTIGNNHRKIWSIKGLKLWRINLSGGWVELIDLGK
ncbi:hypothetical protein NSP_8930 [Nodularia spumigena CCY9414]|nr:hypothetical protein NSP_8930 [Nodularia spumigena CCY9414]